MRQINSLAAKLDTRPNLAAGFVFVLLIPNYVCTRSMGRGGWSSSWWRRDGDRPAR